MNILVFLRLNFLYKIASAGEKSEDNQSKAFHFEITIAQVWADLAIKEENNKIRKIECFSPKITFSLKICFLE